MCLLFKNYFSYSMSFAFNNFIYIVESSYLIFTKGRKEGEGKEEEEGDLLVF